MNVTKQQPPRPKRKRAAKKAPQTKSVPKPKAFGSSSSKVQSVAAAYSNKNVTGKPSQTHLPNGDCVVEHSEFIQDVPGSVGFSVSGIPINPGQSAMFPWLSQIAPNYESYKFEFLTFTYENAVGSQTAGKVLLGVDFDASDPAPVDKQQFASYQGYSSDAPWKTFTQHNSRDNLSKRSSYYVRSGAVPAGTDVKLYDVGNFFIASQGMADASNVGELYVKYRVKFMTPQIQNPAVGLSKSAAVATVGGVVSLAASSNAPITVTGDATNQTITFVSAFNCIVNSALGCASAPSLVLTGTATRQVPILAASGTTIGVATCQIIATAGQTLIITNAGVTPGNGTTYIAQFNSVAL